MTTAYNMNIIISHKKQLINFFGSVRKEVASMKRGEIWMVNLPMTGTSAQGGKRPCIIVSNNLANNNSGMIHIIPLTTKKKTNLRTHVTIGIDSGLLIESIAMAEQSMLIDARWLIHCVGEIDERTMNKIDTALMIQFGFYDKVKNIISRANARTEKELQYA